MKIKVWMIALLFILIMGQAFPMAGMAAPARQWVRAYQAENAWGIISLEEYNGMLFGGVEAPAGMGSYIISSKDGKNWSPASQPAFGQTFELLPNFAYQDYIYDMIVFRGHLYAGYGAYSFETVPPYEGWEPLQAQIWRTDNGKDWEAVVSDGFGIWANEAVTNFAIFSDVLYIAVANYREPGFQIWRSPNGTDWEMVTSALELGFTLNTDISGFAVYNEMLFITAVDWAGDGSEPVRIWYTVDGNTWQAVTTDGFGEPRRVSPGGFMIFKDSLYLGMMMDKAIGDPWGMGDAALWKTNNGLDWQPVTLAELAGHGYFKIDGGVVYDGRLYIIAVGWEGMGVWETEDGLSWKLVNEPGFGDPANWASHGSYTVEKFKGDLFFGTWNYMGTPGIWRWCTACQ